MGSPHISNNGPVVRVYVSGGGGGECVRVPTGGGRRVRGGRDRKAWSLFTPSF